MKPALKSFVFFAVWILVTVPLFRPFGYVSIALLVVLGSLGAEVVAHWPASSPVNAGFAAVATQAASFAALGAAALTGMFFVVLFAIQVTGPDMSYDTPAPAVVLLRAFLCAFIAALPSIYTVRKIFARRRRATIAPSTDSGSF